MTYSITHKGKVLTNNDAISKHWRTNKKLKDELKSSFYYKIKQAKMKFIETYEFYCFANTRHDLDNLSMTCKIFQDQMKEAGVITDDSPKYCKGFHIIPDKRLNKGTIVFRISPLGEGRGG